MVSSGVRDVTLVTHICSPSAECFFQSLQPFVTKLGIVVHHHEPECHAKKWDSIFKVKVTVWAYIYNQHMTVSSISFISSKPASLLQPNSI